jgi:hypothetical protein
MAGACSALWSACEWGVSAAAGSTSVEATHPERPGVARVTRDQENHDEADLERYGVPPSLAMVARRGRRSIVGMLSLTKR